MAIEFRQIAPLLISFLIGYFADINCLDSSNVLGYNQQSTTAWPALGERRNAWQKTTPSTQFASSSPSNANYIVAARPNYAGIANNGSKTRDYVAPTRSRVRNSSPKPSTASQNQPTYAKQNVGDYVAPIKPSTNTPPRRDFVGSQQPNPISSPKPATQNSQASYAGATNKQNVRDYVAPFNPSTNTPLRRDFVASQQPNSISSPRPNYAGAANKQNVRDYVAPFNPSTNTPPRRDYVAPPRINYAGAVSSGPTSQPVNAPAVAANPLPPRNVFNNGLNLNLPPSRSSPGLINPSSDSSQLDDDGELREFSEQLIKKDVNNAFQHVVINYQGRTRSGSLNDEAPMPLLTINSAAYRIPTIEKLMLLHNNYVIPSNENEVYTGQERIEENDFLDTILSTPVMEYTRNFLVKKGKISKDPKDFKSVLREIWFNMYSRGGGRIGSSGFEHVFLAEIKNDAVSGLHNWLYFNAEENRNLANYLGYMKTLEFDKGAIIKHHFNFHQVDKPVGTMFIGTSPEFEVALYSTCFLMRPDGVCPLRLGGKNFIIRTFTYRYRGKNMIGSAFPEI